jgi:hypothetical protein
MRGYGHPPEQSDAKYCWTVPPPSASDWYHNATEGLRGGTLGKHALVQQRPSERRSWAADVGQGTKRVNEIDQQMSRLDHCRVVDLPKIEDERGNLTVLEDPGKIGFTIRRVYYLYDVPSGAARGGHAHMSLHQLIIAVAGSFDVVIDDGEERRRVHLNRPYRALHLVPMIWREIDNFSSGSVCLVLASETFDEADYIRDYDTFNSLVADTE